jgi:hypothetical protein
MSVHLHFGPPGRLCTSTRLRARPARGVLDVPTQRTYSMSNAFPDVPGDEASRPNDSLQSVRETLQRADAALRRANQPVCTRPRELVYARASACVCVRPDKAGWCSRVPPVGSEMSREQRKRSSYSGRGRRRPTSDLSTGHVCDISYLSSVYTRPPLQKMCSSPIVSWCRAHRRDPQRRTLHLEECQTCSGITARLSVLLLCRLLTVGMCANSLLAKTPNYEAKNTV